MEAYLAELEPLLYGCNYAVFLRVYRVAFIPDAPAEHYITEALGSSAVIGSVVSVDETTILADVEQSLRYVGDEGSGPEPNALRSRRFKELVPAVLNELKEMIAGAVLLSQFYLREGHPAYPVFWDFAFVIAGPSGGTVFIGSSSD